MTTKMQPDGSTPAASAARPANTTRTAAEREMLAVLESLVPHVLHYASMPHASSEAHRNAATARAVIAKYQHKVACSDQKFVDQVDIEHWNSPRYGGDAIEHNGVSFPAEIIDMRAGSGQLLVNIGNDNGEIDDMLSAAFEITTAIGGKAPVAAMLIYDGDEVCAKLIRQPNGHLIEPTKLSTRVVNTVLPNGETAWMILDR